MSISKVSIIGILELPLNTGNKTTILAFIGISLIVLLLITLITMLRDSFVSKLEDSEELLKDAGKVDDLDFSDLPHVIQTPIESTFPQNIAHSRVAFFLKSILPLLFGLSAIFICWPSVLVLLLTLIN